MELTEEDEQIMEKGLYEGHPYWVILLDDEYCSYIYNRTSMGKHLRRFQLYLIKKKSQEQELKE